MILPKMDTRVAYVFFLLSTFKSCSFLLCYPYIHHTVNMPLIIEQRKQPPSFVIRLMQLTVSFHGNALFRKHTQPDPILLSSGRVYESHQQQRHILQQLSFLAFLGSYWKSSLPLHIKTLPMIFGNRSVKVDFQVLLSAPWTPIMDALTRLST
ncbi:hypothetical protein K492DRAFT_86562 [Lichtheimia hyalospora FSU 10163]|nr:hypothetical protein K492DRAFT_86562 [Lichtheimia hyalospora FSU 10163]